MVRITRCPIGDLIHFSKVAFHMCFLLEFSSIEPEGSGSGGSGQGIQKQGWELGHTPLLHPAAFGATVDLLAPIFLL